MGHLTPYRYFFDYRNKGRGTDTDIHGAEARDVMKCLTGHRTAMNNKELSDPKMSTVLRLRNGCRWSGLPKHWPQVVICLLPDRDGLWVSFLRPEAQLPLQPLPVLEFWGLLLMQLFSFMTKKGVEHIGAPVWKGTLPAQTDVCSRKKKMLESLVWTLLLCVVKWYSLSLWGMDEYCSFPAECPAYKPHCPQKMFHFVIFFQRSLT